MPKLKIIRSYSLECLQERIQNKIKDSDIQIDILQKELKGIRNHDPGSMRVSAIESEILAFDVRIRTQREALNDIALFVSEIEI